MLGVLVHRIVALRPLPTSPQLQQLLVLLLAEGWDEKVKGAADAEEQSAVAFQHRISRSRGRGKKRRRGEEEEEYD